MNTRSFFAVSVCAALVGIMVSAASATVIEQDLFQSDASGQTAFDGNISATDLINQGTQSLFSVVTTGTSRSSTNGINDGAASGPAVAGGPSDFSHDTFYLSDDLAAKPTVTFVLNTMDNPSGYDITRINSINGWIDDHSFSNQKYTVSYATVSDPLTFKPLASVDYEPFDANDNGSNPPNSSQVTLTDSTGTLAGNVAAIQFQFAQAGAQNGQVIREIDVFGTAAASAVPEPAAPGLIGFAAVALLRRRRSRC